MRYTFTAALLGASSVMALPAVQAELEDRTGNLACLVVDSVVTALSAAASASPFCSSYLGIKTSTVYTTTTSTSYLSSTITSTTGTNTVTAETSTVPTVTLDTVTAPTVTYTATADAVTVTTCIPSTAAEKRGVKTTSKSSTTSLATSTKSSIPTPDCLKNLASTAVSLACSCLHVPTPTSTSTIVSSVYPTTSVTTLVAATATTTPLTTPYYTPVTTPSTTVTVTPTSTDIYCPSPTPDLSCSNQGAQFAYYVSPFGVNSDGSYSQFNPTYFKTQTTTVSGVAGSAGGISGSCPYTSSTFSFYGYTENCNNIALNYRGYLYAGQTGAFTFQITSADDIVLVWAGATAHSGWTRANALLDVTYPELGAGSGGGGSIIGTYTATAGEYIPIRILFSQGDGPFGFNVQVTAPDGTVVLSASSSTSDYLVQYSCDGTTAPAYAPYGSET
ncbi:GLEYA domain-containing protein [Pestalotiopsis sp. NC0098]|nr:GLEYA domain-containing protein [Pestalotiopsis sp. NC0098]